MDQLQDSVIRLFSEIENKNVEVPSWKDPYTEADLKQTFKVVPIKVHNKQDSPEGVK